MLTALGIGPFASPGRACRPWRITAHRDCDRARPEHRRRASSGLHGDRLRDSGDKRPRNCRRDGERYRRGYPWGSLAAGAASARQSIGRQQACSAGSPAGSGPEVCHKARADFKKMRQRPADRSLPRVKKAGRPKSPRGMLFGCDRPFVLIAVLAVVRRGQSRRSRRSRYRLHRPGLPLRQPRRARRRRPLRRPLHRPALRPTAYAAAQAAKRILRAAFPPRGPSSGFLRWSIMSANSSPRASVTSARSRAFVTPRK